MKEMISKDSKVRWVNQDGEIEFEYNARHSILNENIENRKEIDSDNNIKIPKGSKIELFDKDGNIIHEYISDEVIFINKES